MKKALINNLEPGRVCEVREPGSEFEVSPDFQWIDCPDDTTVLHTYNSETGVFTAFDILTSPGFAENAWRVARVNAYGPIGDQLDMIYKEIQANGSISSNGAWATLVNTVKSTIPKDDPAAVLEYIRNNPPE